MARHALFPETQMESSIQASTDDMMADDETDGAEDDLDALLATLEGWNSQDKPRESSSEANMSMNSSNDSSNSSEGVLVDELQAWRTQHAEQSYDKWVPEKKQEFMVSVVVILKLLHNTESISVGKNDKRVERYSSIELTK
jgi:hypothetical protein